MKNLIKMLSGVSWELRWLLVTAVQCPQLSAAGLYPQSCQKGQLDHVPASHLRCAAAIYTIHLDSASVAVLSLTEGAPC